MAEQKAARRKLVFRSRPLPALRVRKVVQFVSVAIVCWVGVQFALWYGAVRAGLNTMARPAGVEGFLPISAMISLRHLVETGEFSMIHPAGLVIFGLALLTGLLLKKAFCSWICPIGTASDGLAMLAHRVLRRRVKLPAWLDYPLMSLKYLLLAFFAYAVFFKMTPASIDLFLHSPYNKVADIKMMLFFAEITPFALWTVVALVALSFLVPYFWCRYLCPYGALLSLLSVGSLLKVRRSKAACVDCGRCAAACPAYIDVDRKAVVRSSECTGCLECVASCPAPGALDVTPPLWRRAVRPLVYAALVVALFFGGIGVAKLVGRWETEISAAEYVRRAQEIESPKYHHNRGQVPEYGPED